ncbi:hypothetical protein TGFOU_261955B, partial [Toxoplasma gondii FOU]
IVFFHCACCVLQRLFETPDERLHRLAVEDVERRRKKQEALAEQKLFPFAPEIDEVSRRIAEKQRRSFQTLIETSQPRRTTFPAVDAVDSTAAASSWSSFPRDSPRQTPETTASSSVSASFCDAKSSPFLPRSLSRKTFANRQRSCSASVRGELEAKKKAEKKRDPYPHLQSTLHDMATYMRSVEEERRRKALARQRYKQQLEAKEMEECTFQPRLQHNLEPPVGELSFLEVKGFNRFIELRLLAQKKEEEKRQREVEVFGASRVSPRNVSSRTNLVGIAVPDWGAPPAAYQRSGKRRSSRPGGDSKTGGTPARPFLSREACEDVHAAEESLDAKKRFSEDFEREFDFFHQRSDTPSFSSLSSSLGSISKVRKENKLLRKREKPLLQ